MTCSVKCPPSYIRHGVAFRSRRSWPTVNAYFRGDRVTPASRADIEDALREIGCPEWLRTEPDCSPTPT